MSLPITTTVPWRNAVEALSNQIVTLVTSNAATMPWKDTQNALNLADHKLRLRSRGLSQVIPQTEPVTP
jgi:hypothetical protein